MADDDSALQGPLGHPDYVRNWGHRRQVAQETMLEP